MPAEDVRLGTEHSNDQQWYDGLRCGSQRIIIQSSLHLQRLPAARFMCNVTCNEGGASRVGIGGELTIREPLRVYTLA